MNTTEKHDELIACRSVTPLIKDFNRSALLPHGCTVSDVHKAMTDFSEFLAYVNESLHARQIPRLETMLMPANFSSIVGEFVCSAIPKYCNTIVKNRYHNGHPDLIEAGRHPDDSVKHFNEGIEIKASRYLKGWQGHNAEDAWLMVFVFASDRPVDLGTQYKPSPFRFVATYGAQLIKKDWNEAPRKAGSRRTATASVLQTGYEKMTSNWIYRAR